MCCQLFGSVVANGQVTAGFTATDTAGCAPLIVRFTNKSVGATSYSWDLGNGTISSLTDVSGSFTAAGTYTVSLTAYAGGAVSTSKMILRVYGKPVVNFYASDSSVCKNTPITFTSTSVSNAWGGISYIWNFGDGSSSSSGAPVYSYPSPGSYNVTLFATNVKGCSNSLTKSNYIKVLAAPFASFSAATTTFCAALGKAFFVNSSVAKTPATYMWVFGDGMTSTATSPTHSYTAPAQYNVKLIVEDVNGCYDSTLQLNYITVGDLKAAFSPVSSGCLATPVKFNNTSSAHISSQWYFGDGNTSVADSASNSFASTGVYAVKLVVSDGSCADSVVHNITISRPAASINITPECTPASTQKFSATGTPGNTYTWDFGDMTGGPGTSFVHTYHPPPALGFDPPPDSVWLVKLIATSGIGCVDTETVVDTVKSLFVKAATTSVGGCVPFTTSFSANAQYAIINPDPPCGLCTYLTFSYPYSIVVYSWDFGDGSAPSSSAYPSHTYSAVGVYTVHCRIITSDGCSALDTLTISVGTKQHASFFASRLHACAGAPITFTSTSTSTALIDDYRWNYNDRFLAEGPPSKGYGKVTHKSERPGIHTVYLTVGYNGCRSDADSVVDTIDAPNATISNIYTCIPANGMTFTDESVGDDSHLWQFGDGTTSTLNSVVHLYPGLSSYPVKLTTYNATTGCRDTSGILVEMGRLRASLTPYYTNICRDQLDTFATIVSYTDSTFAQSLNWSINRRPLGIHSPVGMPAAYLDTFRHSMFARGNDTVTVVVSDNHSCLDTSSVVVMVGKPIDSFDLTPATACPATVVSFSDRTSDVPGFSIINYSWSFGDGTSQNSAVPVMSHRYASAGTYTIQERVTDNFGCSDTFTSPVHPLVHKPTAGFIPGSTYNCKGTTINFDNTSKGSISYTWAFGDGGTSTLAYPSHTYTAVGKYTVQLVATDMYGCTDTLTENDLISINPLPHASFYMDDSFAVCAPLNVNFINTSTGAPYCNWNFGDGLYSTALYPSDIYTAPGVYKITLEVSNSYGCLDSASGHATIFGYAGAFSYTPSSACASLPVHFSGAISGVTSVVWDFNDGYISLPSLKDTISHIYMTPGSYLPKLILTDFSGCTSFSLGADTIRVDTVIAKFGAVPEPVCQNSPAVFHDSSFSMYSAPAAWLWTFASGVTSTARAPAYAYSVAGTASVTLLVTDSFGCSGTVSQNITVNPSPATITGSSAVCLGQAVALSDITAGGTWSSSNTSRASVDSATGVVSGMAAGTATISYSLATGCRATIQETVEPLPLPVTGIKTICAGQTIALSDRSPGGAWSCSNTAIAVIGSASGNITGIATGTATLSYTLPTGCITTAIIKIDSSPGPIFGPQILCVGDTILLSDAVAGGGWSAGNSSVAIPGSAVGSVAALTAGTATISYTLSTGCKTSLTVTTNPLPLPVSGTPVVCQGLTTVLSDITPGGSWKSSNVAVATVASGAVSGKTVGTTTITYTLATGCMTSETVTVNPLPLPITGSSTVCLGQYAVLSDLSGGGKWGSVDAAVSVGTLTGMVTGVSAGTANITYELTTGCLAARSLTVAPVPSAITGIKNICVGLTTVLADSTSGGTWTSSTSSVIIGPVTGIAKGLAVGPAKISYTLSTGCSTITTVTVDPLPPSISGNNRLCVGSVLALADSVSGGTWSSGTTAIASVDGAGTVTGVAPGFAVITYSASSGCIAMTTVSVYPVMIPFTAKDTLCQGMTITLSDPITGGSWVSSDNAILKINSSGLVTAVAAGSATISYFALNTCDTATRKIVVDPLPHAGTITGSASLCSNASEMFADTVPGGVWSVDNNNIATISNAGLLSGVAPGVVNVTYSFTNSCGTAKTATTVVVSQAPPNPHISVHPDTSLCMNTMFMNFGADIAPPPGCTYKWTAENAIIYATSSVGQYCLVTFNSQGSAVVVLTTSISPSGCFSRDSIDFSINAEESPMPVAVYTQPEFVCKDNTADGYQWGYDDVHSLDSTLLPGMVNQNYYNPDPDFRNNNYWVLTYHNGCLQKSYYNAPEYTGIASGNNADISVFPNPAGSEINIEISGMNRPGLTSVRLLDMLGKEHSVYYVVNGTGKITLYGLPSGVYVLLFSKNGINIGSKVFVKN